MILELQHCVRSGGYSDIFWNADGDRVFKLFISGEHPSNVAQGLTHPDHDKQRRETFQAECEAYRIAMGDAVIRRHVPRFYGSVQVGDVVNEHGDSVAVHYLMDCCYSLEACSGTDLKLSLLRAENCPHRVTEVLARMRVAGIGYSRDASILMPDDAAGFKIIDFATREIPAPIYDM